METTIGDFDPATRSVAVKFVGADSAGAEVTHDRAVPACFDKAGAYDADATAARVAQLVPGVTAKMLVGAIVNPPPIEEPEAPADAAGASDDTPAKSA